MSMRCLCSPGGYKADECESRGWESDGHKSDGHESDGRESDGRESDRRESDRRESDGHDKGVQGNSKGQLVRRQMTATNAEVVGEGSGNRSGL